MGYIWHVVCNPATIHLVQLHTHTFWAIVINLVCSDELIAPLSFDQHAVFSYQFIYFAQRNHPTVKSVFNSSSTSLQYLVLVCYILSSHQLCSIFCGTGTNIFSQNPVYLLRSECTQSSCYQHYWKTSVATYTQWQNVP